MPPDTERLSRLASYGGHLWTLAPTAGYMLRPPAPPPSTLWRARLDDPDVGRVGLSGWWTEVPRSEAVVVIIHGLGGDAVSPYVVQAARAAARARLSCLRLAMRGADGSGDDFYHAGLTADVVAALRSEELARYRHVLLLGYSLGGHLCLRAALDGVDDRLRAVAAVCPPLDLAAVQWAIDGPLWSPYRSVVLASLKRAYAAVARRRAVPTALSAIRAVRTVRRYDSLAVVPRFGFRHVDDYYTRTSVGTALPELAIPALIVASRRDPMIPVATMAPSLRHTSPHLQMRWIDGGGHMYFPSALAIGVPGPVGLEDQIVGWLAARCG